MCEPLLGLILFAIVMSIDFLLTTKTITLTITAFISPRNLFVVIVIGDICRPPQSSSRGTFLSPSSTSPSRKTPAFLDPQKYTKPALPYSASLLPAALVYVCWKDKKETVNDKERKDNDRCATSSYDWLPLIQLCLNAYLVQLLPFRFPATYLKFTSGQGDPH